MLVSFSISKQETRDKMWVGSGFGKKKKGRIAGLRRKYRQEGGFENPYCGPSVMFSRQKIYFLDK